MSKNFKRSLPTSSKAEDSLSERRESKQSRPETRAQKIDAYSEYTAKAVFATSKLEKMVLEPIQFDRYGKFSAYMRVLVLFEGTGPDVGLGSA